MNKKELMAALHEKDIHKVYGRSLSSALKHELEDYLKNSSQFGNVRHFSASQVNTYDRCPTQYYWRYGPDKLVIPPGAFQATGGAYHKSVEHNHREKIASGKDEPVDVLEDVFVEDLHTREDDTDWSEMSMDECESVGRGLVGVYRTQLAPPIYPLKVEHKFKVEFEDRDWVLTGYIDCVANADGEYPELQKDNKTVVMVKLDTKNLVLDYKTAGKKKNQAEVDADQQLTAYSLAHSIEAGEREGGVGLAVAVKTKVAKTQILLSTRTEEQHWRYLRKVEEITKAIRAGIFVPTNPTNWQCSEKWCGYYNHCMKEW